MAVIIVILGSHLITQVFIMAMSIITAVIINGHVDGLSRKKRNMEFINETIIMFVLYNMICFSPFVPDNNARIVMGYFCCFIVSLHLFVNLGLITATSVKAVFKTLRLWLKKRHLAKQRREQKSAMAAAMVVRGINRKLNGRGATAEEKVEESKERVRRRRQFNSLVPILELEEDSEDGSRYNDSEA